MHHDADSSSLFQYMVSHIDNLHESSNGALQLLYISNNLMNGLRRFKANGEKLINARR